MRFPKRLPKIALVATYGRLVSENTDKGNPGEGFVHFALVPSAECREAAKRVRKL